MALDNRLIVNATHYHTTANDGDYDGKSYYEVEFFSYIKQEDCCCRPVSVNFSFLYFYEA